MAFFFMSTKVSFQFPYWGCATVNQRKSWNSCGKQKRPLFCWDKSQVAIIFCWHNVLSPKKCNRPYIAKCSLSKQFGLKAGLKDQKGKRPCNEEVYLELAKEVFVFKLLLFYYKCIFLHGSTYTSQLLSKPTMHKLEKYF